MTLTKTAALRQACKLIKLQRFGDQWQLAHPWRMADPSGPWTTGQPHDWSRARRYLTEARAEYALTLMGHKFPCVYEFEGDLAAIVTRYHSHNCLAANARLIAAAPDLLAALQGLLADKYLADPINTGRMAAARAAVAKATD